MAVAIYHKMNDTSLWEGYDQGWNLITSSMHDCDRFEVLYDVLGKIFPKLNINSTKAGFIQKPVYTNLSNDSIYDYITAYKAFVKFGNLGTNKRTYSQYEHDIYIQ